MESSVNDNLEELLNENNKLESILKEQDSKLLELEAHQKTLVATICGNEIQYYFPPRIADNKSNFEILREKLTNSTFDQFPTLVINKPEPFVVSKENFYKQMSSISSCEQYLLHLISYKAIKVFKRSRLTKHNHRYEFYKTIIFRWENRPILEISDSEGNVFHSFTEFASMFDEFPFDLHGWLALTEID